MTLEEVALDLELSAAEVMALNDLVSAGEDSASAEDVMAGARSLIERGLLRIAEGKAFLTDELASVADAMREAGSTLAIIQGQEARRQFFLGAESVLQSRLTFDGGHSFSRMKRGNIAAGVFQMVEEERMKLTREDQSLTLVEMQLDDDGQATRQYLPLGLLLTDRAGGEKRATVLVNADGLGWVETGEGRARVGALTSEKDLAQVLDQFIVERPTDQPSAERQ